MLLFRHLCVLGVAGIRGPGLSATSRATCFSGPTISLSYDFAPCTWNRLSLPKTKAHNLSWRKSKQTGLMYLRQGNSTLSLSGCPSSLTSTRSRNQPLPLPLPSCLTLTRLTFRMVTDSMVNSSAFVGKTARPVRRWLPWDPNTKGRHRPRNPKTHSQWVGLLVFHRWARGYP